MAKLTTQIHQLGMKVMLWFSTAYLGVFSEQFAAMKDKVLNPDSPQLNAYVLDPRYPEVRTFLISTLTNALRNWQLDGLKLDFIDEFHMRPDTPVYAHGMDIPLLEQAVHTLMIDIMKALRSIRPDVLIEFRQRYIGPCIDVFSGMVYDGHRGVINYRMLDEMPVFAKAGAIVPLAVPDTWNSIENPNQLEVQVFPGADGSFILYEDDGRTNAYEQGACVRTAFTWHWQDESELTIVAPQGDTSLIPEGRHYTIIFRATEAEQVTANTPCTVTHSGRDIHVRLDSTCDSIVLHLKGCRIAPNPVKERIFSILDTACWDYAKKEQAWKWINSDLSLTAVLSTLEDMDMPEHLRRAMIEVMIARTESTSYRH